MSGKMIFAKYVGDGRWVDGVPQSDLNREQWERLSDRQREIALDDGVYELVKAPAKEKPVGKEEAPS